MATDDNLAELRPLRLQDEEINPTADGLRDPWSTFDPTGVKPSTLLGYMEAARGGEDRDLQEYGKEVIKRDAHVRSQMQSRVLSIMKTGVVVEPASEEPRDLEIAEVVQRELVEARWWNRIRNHFAWATWYGYTVAELVWRPGADLWRLHVIDKPNKYFVWSQDTGTELLLRSRKSTPGEYTYRSTFGLPMPRGKVACHTPFMIPGLPIEGGILWTIAAYHLFSSFALRAWMDLGEKHGQPTLVGHQPKDATPKQRTAFRSALRNFKRDTSLNLPPGFRVEILDAMAEGRSDFHKNLMEWLDKSKSKAIRGQTMTAEDGSSLSQAQVHQDQALDIRDADAQSVDDAMHADIVSPFCEVNFEERPYGWPRVFSKIARKDDIGTIAKAVQDMSTAAKRPIPIRMVDAITVLGFGVPEDGDLLLDGSVMGPDGVPIPPEGEEDPGADVSGDDDEEGEEGEPSDDGEGPDAEADA